MNYAYFREFGSCVIVKIREMLRMVARISRVFLCSIAMVY